MAVEVVRWNCFTQFRIVSSVTPQSRATSATRPRRLDHPATMAGSAKPITQTRRLALLRRALTELRPPLRSRVRRSRLTAGSGAREGAGACAASGSVLIMKSITDNGRKLTFARTTLITGAGCVALASGLLLTPAVAHAEYHCHDDGTCHDDDHGGGGGGGTGGNAGTGGNRGLTLNLFPMQVTVPMGSSFTLFGGGPSIF